MCDVVYDRARTAAAAAAVVVSRTRRRFVVADRRCRRAGPSVDQLRVDDAPVIPATQPGHDGVRRGRTRQQG